MNKPSFSENTSKVVVLSGLELLLENARLRLRVQDDTASQEDSDTSDSDSCTDYEIGFEEDSIKLITVQRVNHRSYNDDHGEEEEGRDFEYGLDDSDRLCTESSILGQCPVALERRKEVVSITTKKKIPHAIITPPAVLFKSQALLDGKDEILEQKAILHPATTCRLKRIHNSAA